MKNLRRIIALALALSMLLALNMTAFAAADTGYTDVDAGAWYADAVQYVREHGLMNGTSAAEFSPNEATNLAMVVTILHRDAGMPAAGGDAPVGASGWYGDAAAWAGELGLLADVNAVFTGAPITREDMVTILWRYIGAPAGSGGDFSDEAQISAYASQAVDWAQANGIVNGKSGNLFDPKGSTTRAELAAILQRFLTLKQQDAQPELPSPSGGNTLVVYFSASGNTEAAAKTIAGALDADLFELIPETPYTSADLNWTDPGSRVNAEHNDPSKQDVKLAKNTVDNWADYDTIFIGYPIWWGNAAWPVNGFVKNNDFTGKTVIPFCTSASSGLGQSGTLLAEMADGGSWLEGRRFSERASQSDITAWINGLDIPARHGAPTVMAAGRAALSKWQNRRMR